MVEPPEFVRAPQKLEAAVLFRRLVERHVDAHHLRREATIDVPKAEILMPLPRTTYTRLLLHHLTMPI